MTLPVTIPYAFATASGSIPLSQLDSDFTAVANAVNGIANGTNALPNVNITGGGVANTTITNATIANATYSGQPFSPTNGFRRNRIINGAMQIDQRNNGAAQTIATAGTYTVDRWNVAIYGAASTTAQRVAGPSGYQYAYQINGAAGTTLIDFQQRIESYNVADLVNQNVTISVTIANTLLTTVSWRASFPNTPDNIASGETHIASGTWTVSPTATTYSVTFNAGANAANGLIITFSVLAQTSGNWTITGVQLEAGSYATPFERQIYSDTLAQCQRYYCTVTMNAQSPVAGQVLNTYYFPVTMRITPSKTNLSAGTISNATVFIDDGSLNTSSGYFQIIATAVNGYNFGRLNAYSAEL